MVVLVPAHAQETSLLWDSTKYFKYNILFVSHDTNTHVVTAVFNVTNPEAANTPYNVLSGDPPFKSPATLRVNVGWNAGSWGTAELVNTGSNPGTAALNSIIRGWMNFTPPNPGGVGPSYPNVVNALSASATKPCTAPSSPCAGFPNPGLTFWVQTTLPPQASGAGRVAIEGHPSLQTGTDALGQPVYGSVPVKSVYQDFQITTGAQPRRQVVEFSKCQGCHDGGKHGDTIVPRLSLHGANRNEEPGLCVMCHNPGQTDAAYRSSGAEESIDFKRLVHGIHAGGFRKTPLVIIGFRGSVNDFSHVRFPAELRKSCLYCHIDNNGKGTFELPLASKLGSTIVSASMLSPLPGFVDVNPANDLKISPIAATCSACHDSREVREHMQSKGASFGAYQSVLEGKERCVTCHGPGKEKDVRRAHEISSSGTSGGGSDDDHRRGGDR